MKTQWMNRAVASLMIGAVALIGTSGPAFARTATQEPTEAPAPKKSKNAAKRQKSPKPVTTVDETGKNPKPQGEPRPKTKAPLDPAVGVEPQREPKTSREPKAPRDSTMTVSPQREPGTVREPRAPLDTDVTVEPRRQPNDVREPNVVREPKATRRVVIDPNQRVQGPARVVRLPRERQQQLIVENRERSGQYRQRLYAQERLAQQRADALRQERRMAQYRYQQQYYAALRRQRLAIDNARYYNYNSDPYYYTAASFRYERGGSYYETNRYGADILRQAVNYGYEQGFRAGDADRQDRWNQGYENGFAYQDANYGYSGRYVDQETYNYYFREGYRRGYEDGYNRRSEYGHRSSTSTTGLIVLASVLAGIVVLEAIDD